MKKLSLVLIVIAALVFASACSKTSASESKPGEGTQKAEAKDKTKGKEGEEPGTEAVPVQVIRPVRGDITSFLLFSSNVDSEKMVDIYPLTSGIIEKINFDEGDRVEKDAVLAVLDDREASLNEEKARINFQQLEAEFRRQEEIFKKELISKEDFEKQKYALDSARLDWKQQKLLLSYTRITSPIAGVVSRRHIKVGNKITTNQLAFSVVNTREKIVVVNIPGQERDQIYLKQDARVSAGKLEVPGFVKRISPAIDPDSGTFKVTLQVKDGKDLLAVGQFVNVKIIKKVHKSVVLLTKDALIYDGGKIFVFIVGKDNLVQKKQVITGFEDGTRVEILQGVSEQDRVVTAGKSSLKNKTLVRTVDPVVS